MKRKPRRDAAADGPAAPFTGLGRLPPFVAASVDQDRRSLLDDVQVVERYMQLGGAALRAAHLYAVAAHLGRQGRAARIGRNPKTGEELKIAAAKVPAFKPGATLKAAVNGQDGKD